ncbi:MAG: type II toxin-antitoxin system PemK/MazF family toxin [Candidatus Diapherotrites archaeon]|nr:type II toxin-antitoxin system PemK/MazF family toxin [Candidatus Diapherotrites archaeon]
MNSLIFEQGDIVIANVLFSEQIGMKTRPALVISNSEFNKKSDDLILLKITSKGKKTQFDVNLTSEDVTEGFLKQESNIMVDNPVTVYKRLIETKTGKITKQKLKEVKQKIKELYQI